MVLPPAGRERLVMREGPGERYPSITGVDPSQELLATGSGLAHDGTRWLRVAAIGGVTGFVPENALIERDAVVQPLECPAGKICANGAVTATENLLGLRYRELLGSSDAEGRRTLEAGQRVWESARRACNDQALPVGCRVDAGTRRLGALDDYAIRRPGG